MKRIRHISDFVFATVYIILYFELIDRAEPHFVDSHEVWLWWITLILYLAVGLAYVLWQLRKLKQPDSAKRASAYFVLLGLFLVFVDPIWQIQSPSLRWLFLVPAILFGWLIIRYRLKDPSRT